MISIIVPAHNEGAVLQRCLEALLRDARPGELEVIVAANGCTDDTAAIAVNFGPPVRLINVPAASKTAAINAADAEAFGFPRFYVDADVELETAAVRAVAAALHGPVLAASPGLDLDCSESDLLVRSYYRIWCQLPSVRDDLVGRGVYAVSRAGRQRFGQFPDVLNDDHFFRGQFRATERTVVPSCWSKVRAPRNVDALIARKVRVRLGNEASVGGGSRWAGLLAVLRAQPLRIVDAPAFIWVAIAAGFKVRRVRESGAAPDWGRDDSSRAGLQA